MRMGIMVGGGYASARHLTHSKAQTLIRIKGEAKYLSRAVDNNGQPSDFLVTARREACAAQRFFRKVLRGPGDPHPRVINVDKTPASPAAVEALKEEGVLRRRCRLCQCKYLNNIIGQDHRTVKQRVWLAEGDESFRTAWRTLRGIEAVGMTGLGGVRWVAKGDAVGQARFISQLFDLAA